MLSAPKKGNTSTLGGLGTRRMASVILMSLTEEPASALLHCSAAAADQKSANKQRSGSKSGYRRRLWNYRCVCRSQGIVGYAVGSAGYSIGEVSRWEIRLVDCNCEKATRIRIQSVQA